MSKNALKNKKKREKQREKKAAEGGSWANGTKIKLLTGGLFCYLKASGDSNSTATVFLKLQITYDDPF